MKHSWNYNSLEKMCPICKKGYTVSPSRLILGRGKFCSKKCYVKDMSNRPGLFRGKKHTLKTINNIRDKKIGQKQSLETRLKRSMTMKKTLNVLPSENKREIRRRLMGQLEYRLWRTAVFVRDSYTCQTCGQHGGNMEADHIKPWSLYPELRYAIDNGRTLCVECHRQTDTYGYKGKLKTVTLEGIAY